MNQARRLGRSFAEVAISKIYASDLKRAHWTALQIATQNRGLLANVKEEGAGKGNGEAQEVGTSASEQEVRSSDSSSRRRRSSGQDCRNDLDDETEDEIACNSAGPHSLVSTDRGFSEADLDYADSDDFTISSSAAASSPVPSTSTSTSTTTATSSSLPTSSCPSTPSSSSTAPVASAANTYTVTTTPLLREQFFGAAEGQSWHTGYTVTTSSYHNRAYKFEQGESLEDVQARAKEIVGRCVLPWLVNAAREGKEEHVVLVAHGIMISELLFALAKLQDPRAPCKHCLGHVHGVPKLRLCFPSFFLDARQSGHTNTGWTRLSLSFPSSHLPSLPAPSLPPLTSPSLPPYYIPPSLPSSRSLALKKSTCRQTATGHFCFDISQKSITNYGRSRPVDAPPAEAGHLLRE